MSVYIARIFMVGIFLLMLVSTDWVAELFSVASDAVHHSILVGSQLAASIIILFSLKRSETESQRQFWRFLLLAVVSMLLMKLIRFGIGEPVSLQLFDDFSTLFVYFFVLLSIETNPHLSNTPLPQYTNGRVPAILFTVICFCYFILVPAGFAKDTYLNENTSLYFNSMISTLVLIKLTHSLLQANTFYWRTIYLLFISSAMIQSMTNISVLHGPDSLFSHMLYFDVKYGIRLVWLIIFATAVFSVFTQSSASVKNSRPIETTNVIMLLFSLLIAAHLWGTAAQTGYMSNPGVQSLVVMIWLLIGTALIISINRQRNKVLARQISDITELTIQNTEQSQKIRHLNNSLIYSEDKAIVNVSNNAILTTTVAGEILSANPAAVQMFQYIEKDLKSMNVGDLFANDDEMRYFFKFQSNVFSLQRKDPGISRECLSLRSDGKEFPVQAELQWAERYEQPLIVITFINLTSRKLAEQQTLELKDKFIANISHEFRTPLTIINGIIDRYLSKPVNDSERLELDTAKRNGLRLVRMVEQLLELSRLSNNPTLTQNTYRVKSLMDMPTHSFTRLAEQSQLTFSHDIADNLWIECDAQGFEKIIFNLLSNAMKYTPKGGSVAVNVYEADNEITIDITDSGIGISKQYQDKIFDRFQRVEDSMTHNTFGVGIGLSLVNELVKAHGWRMNLVSEEGRGSKFSLIIPKAEPGAEQDSAPQSLFEDDVNTLLTEQRSVTTSQVEHSQQVVLVIEDNPDMQSHIKYVIEQHHHCLIAGSGESGIDLARKYIPDLIVCDLMLPGIDGFSVLKSIKSHEVTAHIPIILLTARSDLDSRLEGLELNADEYLCKPFNQNELLIRIKNLIDTRKQLQQHYLQQFASQQKDIRHQQIQQNAAELTETAPEEESADDKFLRKLEKLVSEQYTDPQLDISTLASELAMSERQLQRKMNSLLGISPNNFIKKFRLKKAQELLKSGNQIGRIAMDVGFSSQTYFGRCFKEEFDCTPTQYQKQWNENQSA